MSLVSLKKPYALFVGDVPRKDYLKTGYGLLDWSREDCVAQVALGVDGARLPHLPVMSMAEAKAAGAASLVIGATFGGGGLPEHWQKALIEAAFAGMDVVSGLHDKLEEVPGLKEAAEKTGVRLVNVRYEQGKYPIGNGKKRTGLRLLTVGTDIIVGKKYTALSLTRALQENGLKATFRPTGQTGIMITGEGVPVDAVVSDFIAGAIEQLAPDNAPNHWDIIEGQGSLFHPAYAGVTLGLMHGAQPDAFIVCHDVSRTHLRNMPHVPIQEITHFIAMTKEMLKIVSPDPLCLGIALNTSSLTPDEAETVCATWQEKYGYPCVDPMRHGMEAFVAPMRKMADEACNAPASSLSSK